MLLAQFKTFDLCSEENTSKAFLQLPPVTRSYHVVGYNVQFWYQVTILQTTRHIPLASEIFPSLSKLVTHISSVLSVLVN